MLAPERLANVGSCISAGGAADCFDSSGLTNGRHGTTAYEVEVEIEEVRHATGKSSSYRRNCVDCRFFCGTAIDTATDDYQFRSGKIRFRTQAARVRGFRGRARGPEGSQFSYPDKPCERMHGADALAFDSRRPNLCQRDGTVSDARWAIRSEERR